MSIIMQAHSCGCVYHNLTDAKTHTPFIRLGAVTENISMLRARGDGTYAAPELPQILEAYCKQLWRRGIDNVNDLNLFSARYFATLAGLEIPGVEALNDIDRTPPVPAANVHTALLSMPTVTPASIGGGAKPFSSLKLPLKSFAKSDPFATIQPDESSRSQNQKQPDKFALPAQFAGPEEVRGNVVAPIAPPTAGASPPSQPHAAAVVDLNPEGDAAKAAAGFSAAEASSPPPPTAVEVTGVDDGSPTPCEGAVVTPDRTFTSSPADLSSEPGGALTPPAGGSVAGGMLIESDRGNSRATSTGDDTARPGGAAAAATLLRKRGILDDTSSFCLCPTIESSPVHATIGGVARVPPASQPWGPWSPKGGDPEDTWGSLAPALAGMELRSSSRLSVTPSPAASAVPPPGVPVVEGVEGECVVVRLESHAGGHPVTSFELCIATVDEEGEVHTSVVTVLPPDVPVADESRLAPTTVRWVVDDDGSLLVRLTARPRYFIADGELGEVGAGSIDGLAAEGSSSGADSYTLSMASYRDVARGVFAKLRSVDYLPLEVEVGEMEGGRHVTLTAAARVDGNLTVHSEATNPFCCEGVEEPPGVPMALPFVLSDGPVAGSFIVNLAEFWAALEGTTLSRPSYTVVESKAGGDEGGPDAFVERVVQPDQGVEGVDVVPGGLILDRTVDRVRVRFVNSDKGTTVAIVVASFPFSKHILVRGLTAGQPYHAFAAAHNAAGWGSEFRLERPRAPPGAGRRRSIAFNSRGTLPKPPSGLGGSLMSPDALPVRRGSDASMGGSRPTTPTGSGAAFQPPPQLVRRKPDVGPAGGGERALVVQWKATSDAGALLATSGGFAVVWKPDGSDEPFTMPQSRGPSRRGSVVGGTASRRGSVDGTLSRRRTFVAPDRASLRDGHGCVVLSPYTTCVTLRDVPLQPTAFAVVAFNHFGCGLPSPSRVVDVAALLLEEPPSLCVAPHPPPAIVPHTLTVTQSTFEGGSATLTVEWGNVSEPLQTLGASGGYLVELKQASPSDGVPPPSSVAATAVSEKLPWHSARHTFTGIAAPALYIVSVTPYNDVGSATATSLAVGVYGGPGAVGRPTCEVQDGGVCVSFSADPYATSYKVSWRGPTSGTATFTPPSEGPLTAILQLVRSGEGAAAGESGGLRMVAAPGSYEFSVTAVNPFDEGEASDHSSPVVVTDDHFAVPLREGSETVGKGTEGSANGSTLLQGPDGAAVEGEEGGSDEAPPPTLSDMMSGGAPAIGLIEPSFMLSDTGAPTRAVGAERRTSVLLAPSGPSEGPTPPLVSSPEELLSGGALDTWHAMADLRANPNGCAARLEQLRSHYNASLKSLAVPGHPPMPSSEGFAAYDSAVKVLRGCPKPLMPVQLSVGLSLAAKEIAYGVGTRKIEGVTVSLSGPPAEQARLASTLLHPSTISLASLHAAGDISVRDGSGIVNEWTSLKTLAEAAAPAAPPPLVKADGSSDEFLFDVATTAAKYILNDPAKPVSEIGFAVLLAYQHNNGELVLAQMLGADGDADRVSRRVLLSDSAVVGGVGQAPHPTLGRVVCLLVCSRPVTDAAPADLMSAWDAFASKAGGAKAGRRFSLAVGTPDGGDWANASAGSVPAAGGDGRIGTAGTATSVTSKADVEAALAAALSCPTEVSGTSAAAQSRYRALDPSKLGEYMAGAGGKVSLAQAAVETVVMEGVNVKVALVTPPTRHLTTASNTPCIRFNHSAGHVQARLRRKGDPKDPSIHGAGCFTQTRSDRASVEMFLPGPGEFELDVDIDTTADGEYVPLLTYTVSSLAPEATEASHKMHHTLDSSTLLSLAKASASGSPPPSLDVASDACLSYFPETMFRAQFHYMHTPRRGVLDPTWNDFVVEVVHVDSTVGVIIVNEGEQFALEKLPYADIWAGSVLLRPGTCFVAAASPGGQELEPIFRFRVGGHVHHHAPAAARPAARPRPAIRDLFDSGSDAEDSD